MRAFRMRSAAVAVGILVLAVWVAGVEAQDPSLVLVDGGIQFPDGTVQATAAGAASAPVEDTGQTGCWNENGDPRTCAGTGEDGEFQAGVAWPTPRFTDNGDGTVTDNLTGLIWLKDANCPAAGLRTWQWALDWIKNPLNSGGTACSDYEAETFTDWRLPNVKELSSLVDYGESSPPLPPGHPFLRVKSGNYWSSSSLISDPSYAWKVALWAVSTGGKDYRGGFVWPVRGGQ